MNPGLLKALGVPLFTIVLTSPNYAQSSMGQELAFLDQERSNITSSETQVRLPSLFRVKEAVLGSGFTEVKLEGLTLLQEPVGSSTDNIRMPALYAIADVANSTSDQGVKRFAVESLLEPFRSNQLAVRNAAIDALNSILARADRSDEVIILAALNLLYQPADSGNNGTRMPAVHAVWSTVRGTGIESAYSMALDVLENPINSRALIGGMEVRFMAIEAIEWIALEADSLETKRKALDLLDDLPSTDERRAQLARTRIFESM